MSRPRIVQDLTTRRSGMTFENSSGTEPLVRLRCFGPDANPDAPAMGA